MIHKSNLVLIFNDTEAKDIFEYETVKYFITTIKEQPWHVTLGFVLFIMMAFGTVAFIMADNPQFFLTLIAGVLIWALVFWSFMAFFKFVISWVDYKRNDDIKK